MRKSVWVLGLGLLSGTARAEFVGSTHYTVSEGEHPDRNLAIGGGLIIGVPGMVGAEVFGSTTDPKFAPTLYLDARLQFSYGLLAGQYSSDHVGNLNSAFNLQAKVGWAPQFWAYGTTNVGMGGDLSLQDVPAAKAWAFGPFVGLDAVANKWNPSNDNGGERLGFTPTAMGGLHIERAVDISVSTEGYGDAEKREKISVDLSATYGVAGPRRGLGGMLQLRYFGEVFGLPIYTGGEVGGVLAGANAGVLAGDTGAVSTFADTVRFQFIIGGAWEPSVFGRLPALDMECVHQNERISGCQEEPSKPAPVAPAPVAPTPAPTPTPAPAPAPAPTPAAPAPPPAAPAADPK